MQKSEGIKTDGGAVRDESTVRNKGNVIDGEAWSGFGGLWSKIW